MKRVYELASAGGGLVQRGALLVEYEDTPPEGFVFPPHYVMDTDMPPLADGTPYILTVVMAVVTFGND